MSTIGTNKRNFFRVSIEIPVFIRKIFYNKEKNIYYYKEWIELKSKDISGNGIFLYRKNSVDFKVNDYALIKYDLTLKNDFIYIIAKTVRVTDEGFAFNYILFDENRIDRIIKEFLRIENEKRKISSRIIKNSI